MAIGSHKARQRGATDRGVDDAPGYIRCPGFCPFVELFRLLDIVMECMYLCLEAGNNCDSYVLTRGEVMAMVSGREVDDFYVGAGRGHRCVEKGT